MKTLHDGRQVESDSHDWKLECLAKYLASLGLAKRRLFLAGFGPTVEQVLLERMHHIAQTKGRTRPSTGDTTS